MRDRTPWEFLETTRDGLGRRVVYLQMELRTGAQHRAADQVQAAFDRSIGRAATRRRMKPKVTHAFGVPTYTFADINKVGYDHLPRPRVPDKRQELFRDVARAWLAEGHKQKELTSIMHEPQSYISAWLSPTRRMRLSWVALERLALGLGKHPLEVDPDWDDPRREPDEWGRTESALRFHFTIETSEQAQAVADLIKTNPTLLEQKHGKQ